MHHHRRPREESHDLGPIRSHQVEAVRVTNPTNLVHELPVGLVNLELAEDPHDFLVDLPLPLAARPQVRVGRKSCDFLELLQLPPLEEECPQGKDDLVISSLERRSLPLDYLAFAHEGVEPVGTLLQYLALLL